jgi:hypothetical protein
MLDLGTSKETSRTIPPRSSREIPFVFPAHLLREAAWRFPKEGPYPAGCFWTVLYDESICIGLTAEVWNYKKKAPTTLDVTPPKTDTPFWRGFTTITQSTWFSDDPSPNQSMKPTARSRSKLTHSLPLTRPLASPSMSHPFPRVPFSVFATTPCRGLSLSRWAKQAQFDV